MEGGSAAQNMFCVDLCRIASSARRASGPRTVEDGRDFTCRVFALSLIVIAIIVAQLAQSPDSSLSCCWILRLRG